MKKHISLFIIIAVAAVMIRCSSVPPEIKNKTDYVISVSRNYNEIGDVVIRLYNEYAPEHCRNFDSLVSIGFYNGTAFHRVISDFMIQGGCPRSKEPYSDENRWGNGTEDQRRIRAEFNDIPHARGIVSAARKVDKNSASSQFFICTENSYGLDGEYTAFGKVVKGMDIVDIIRGVKTDNNDRPLEKLEMKIKKIKN